MIKVIPAESRFTADLGWLLSRFSFSFAEYNDPNNMSFGALRVFNDDVVQPGKGFGTHPHRDMEIITYVIEGALEHQDSMGNKAQLRAGEVQRMTAGTGLLHSEYNASDKDSVHFLQMWVMPRERGLAPSWDQRGFNVAGNRNNWTPLVSNGSLPGTLRIEQDAAFLAVQADSGKTLTYDVKQGRKIHLFVIKGSLMLNREHSLQNGDAARITDTDRLELHPNTDSHVLLIDLA